MPLSRRAYFILTLIWMLFMGACLHWGRTLALLMWTMWGHLVLLDLALLAVAGLLWSWRNVSRRPAPSGGRMLWGGCLGFTLLLFFWTPLPIERAHIVLYGVLGFLLHRICRPAKPGPSRPAWLLAGCLGLALGAGDELIQHFHPQRVGDFRDVCINALSGWLGVGWAELLYRNRMTAGRK